MTHSHGTFLIYPSEKLRNLKSLDGIFELLACGNASEGIPQIERLEKLLAIVTESSEKRLNPLAHRISEASAIFSAPRSVRDAFAVADDKSVSKLASALSYSRWWTETELDSSHFYGMLHDLRLLCLKAQVEDKDLYFLLSTEDIRSGNFKEINPPAVYKLTGYLEALSDFIRTGELKWYFDVALFEYEFANVDIKLLIKLAYPHSNPEKANITESSIHDLFESLKHKLGRWLQPPVSKILLDTLDIRGEIGEYMNECVRCEDAQVFDYTTSDHLDEFGSGGIAGNFAAVIVDKNQKRCLFLSGGDCD